MIQSTDRRDRFESLFGEVYEPLQRYLGRRLPPEDAQDVLSEVLLTLWRRLDDVPVDGALPWSYGVARLTLVNHRRAKRRQLRLVQRMEREPPRWGGTTESDPALESALAALPPADQEILRLWAWEDLEPREIAVVMGIGVNAATLRLSRARKKLLGEMRRQSPRVGGHGVLQDTEEQSDA